MKMTRIAAVLLRQYYLLRGSPVRLMPIFSWSLINIVLWGFITRYLNTAALPGGHLTTTLLGGVVLWEFLSRAMQGTINSFFEDVWSKNFLNMFATPITIVEYISGMALSGILISLVSIVIIFGAAALFFQLSLAVYGLLMIAFLALLLIFGVALGVFGCGLALRYGPGVEWLIWPIPALLSPFACVFYPLATLPVWMQWIAKALPPVYVFEGMHTIVQSGGLPLDTLGISAILAFLYLSLAGWFFIRVYKSALRSGLIARYSAESVT